jgi:hypothetical protein
MRSMTSGLLAGALLLASSATSAAPVWVGDMETGDTSQWNELNGEHITIVPAPVAQGMYAARIELTNDALWPNGLHRVELHHSPAGGRTDEGAELYFAWSFYLPEVLPTDPPQQIGYWESNQSYQQMMAFEVTGTHIRFVTRQPTNVNQWEADDIVTAGVWHRIAMHILWSKTQGSVDLWFDGIQVVTAAPAETLNDDNDHFTQVGLLRGTDSFRDMPVIVIDDAAEGDTLADVHPEPPDMGTGGAGGAPTTSGTGGTTAQGSGGASSTSSGSGAASATESGGDSGCGCTVVGNAAPTAPAIALLVLLASSLARSSTSAPRTSRRRPALRRWARSSLEPPV